VCENEKELTWIIRERETETVMWSKSEVSKSLLLMRRSWHYLSKITQREFDAVGVPPTIKKEDTKYSNLKENKPTSTCMLHAVNQFNPLSRPKSKL